MDEKKFEITVTRKTVKEIVEEAARQRALARAMTWDDLVQMTQPAKGWTDEHVESAWLSLMLALEDGDQTVGENSLVGEFREVFDPVAFYPDRLVVWARHDSQYGEGVKGFACDLRKMVEARYPGVSTAVEVDPEYNTRCERAARINGEWAAWLAAEKAGES